jgi:hypothetical protein
MAGYSHGAYMVSFGFFPLLAKNYFSLFHSTAHITYSILMLLLWSLFRQNDWMMANPEKYR